MSLKFVKNTTEGAIFITISKFPWTCPHEKLISSQADIDLTPVKRIRAAECFKIGKSSSTLLWWPMGNELVVLCLIDGPKEAL